MGNQMEYDCGVIAPESRLRGLVLGKLSSILLTTLAFCGLSVYGQAPTISCPSNITVNAASGQCSANVTYSQPTATGANTTSTYNYTGGRQTFTVPSGITSITVECWGGQGRTNAQGNRPGGRGGYSRGNLAVTPGQTLYIHVGGGGGVSTTGGYNGGGNAGTNPCAAARAGGGGGASDVRLNSTALSARRIVAGGGGGGGGNRVGGCGRGTGGGGGGGYFGGGGGAAWPYTSTVLPRGGTQTAGGGGGTSTWSIPGNDGTAGGAGFGGRGGNEESSNQSGSCVALNGGFGGGASGANGAYSCNWTGQSGAGGSGYIGGVTGGTMSSNNRSGNGMVRLTYLNNLSVTRTAGQASGTSFGVGTTTNTYTATNAFGTASCSFTVTVVDNQNPSISCPSNMTISNTPGQCSGVASYTTPVGTDNCPGSSTTRTAGMASGATYPIGTTTNTYRVTDGSGNSRTCSFNVTVADNENPTLTCPASVTVNNTPGQCSAPATYAVTANDNCPGETLTRTAGPASGSTFPVGTTPVSYRVTDASGNQQTCTFNVVVTDNENPVASCPSNIAVNNDPGVCTAVVGYLFGSSDNCPGASTSQTAGLASGAAFPIGVTTNTFVVTDAAGNTNSCSFTVTVTDGEDPTIGCPANQNVAGNSACTISLPSYVGATLSGDNCTASPTVTQSPAATGTYSGAGTVIPVTMTATDGGGNSRSCSFNVTIIDTTRPSVSCPANQTFIAGNPCSVNIPNYVPMGVISDNCDAAPSFTQSPASHTLSGHNDMVTITLTGTDASGNANTCSFTATLVDTTSPVITCPANQTVSNNPGQCGANVTYNTVTATDFCATVTPTLTAGLGRGGFFPIGTTTESYTVSDQAGNTTTCSFTVTVQDTEVPYFQNCPNDTTITIDSTSCGVNVTWVVPTEVDNCPISTVITSHVPGANFNPGVETVTYDITDVGGNTANCSFNVTVVQPTIGSGTSAITYNGGFNIRCFGEGNGEATALPSGGCVPYSYNWSTGGTTQTISGLAAGSYTVTITDGFGRTVVDSITLTQPPAFPDTLIHIPGGGAGQCGGDTITLSGEPGFNAYVWSTGSTANAIDVSQSGTYHVTVTDSLGCMKADSATMNFIPWSDPLPLVAPGGFVSLCDGDTMTLDVGGGYFSYEWNNGDSTRSTQVTTSGSYYATVFNGFGCSRGSDTVDVVIVPLPTTPTVTLAGNIFTSSPGPGYQWYLGDSVLIGANNQSYTANVPGTYSVVHTDANGCSSRSDSVQYTVGISDPEAGGDLQVYPNPFANELKVELFLNNSAYVSMQIVDVLGQILTDDYSDQKRPDFIRTIDLSQLSNGIYYVRIKAGDQIWVRKVVKE